MLWDFVRHEGTSGELLSPYKVVKIESFIKRLLLPNSMTIKKNMPKEKGGDRDTYNLEAITGHESEYKWMEDNFNRGYKLDRTVVANYQQEFLSAYSLGISDPGIATVCIGTIPHYLERAQEEYSHKPEVFELIKQCSDPKAIAALDQLIDEFKADFPHIMHTRDEKAVKKFMERAEQLLL